MLLWMVTQAFALDCAIGVYTFSLDRGDVVPPSFVLGGAHGYADPTDRLDLVLRDGAGSQVPLDVDLGPYFVRVSPVEPLAPGAYELLLDTDGYIAESGATFTVSDELAQTPLATPEIIDARRVLRPDPDWGDTRGIDLTFEPVDGVGFYEIEVDDNEAFSSPSLAITTFEDTFVGEGPCGATLDGYQHDVTNWVRVRAVAVDGTASAWSPTESVPAGGPFDVACASAPTPEGALALGLLALLGLRRRR